MYVKQPVFGSLHRVDLRFSAIKLGHVNLPCISATTVAYGVEELLFWDWVG